jgi:cobalamin-dependent methionine synthase I
VWASAPWGAGSSPGTPPPAATPAPQVVAGYKEAGDDYSYIMAEALADRLAEALAEKLHELVRTEDWGYAAGESLNVDDMLKVKYQVGPGPGPGAGQISG